MRVISPASVTDAHCKDTVVIDCHEHRIARLDNPRPDDLRGLIGEPSPQDLRVIPVIGLAQFRNRSPYHLARSRSIFANCIADFYDARRIVFWRLTPFFGYQIACPVYQIRCPTIAPTVSVVGSCLRRGRSVRATKPGSHWTRRWRDMDSNLRFRNRSVPISGQPVRLPSRLTASRQELEVRIHFPPAASLVRT